MTGGTDRGGDGTRRARSPHGTVAGFLRTLHDFERPGVRRALLLLSLQGLTEGFGLLLLVPLLLLLGGGGGAAAGPQGLVPRALGALGIPLALGPVLVVFVVLMGLRALLLSRAALALVRVQLDFVRHLRTELFGALARASWPFLVRRRLPDVVQTVAQDVQRISTGTRDALDLASTALLSLVYVAVAVHISPVTTALVLAVGLALEAFRWPLVRRARELGEATTRIHREAFLVVSEFVSGLKPIKARALEERHAETYVDAITRVDEQRLLVARSALRAQVANQTAVACVLALALALSATRLHLPTSELLVLVVVFARAMPLFSRLHKDLRSVAEMLPAFEAAHELREELEQAAEPAEEPSAWTPTLERELRLDDVSFDYGGDRPQHALAGVDLALPARTTVGLIGPSGAGKSTLVDVVLGLLPPAGGRVLLDGRPLDAAGRRRWRQRVGYVPQETFLLHDTIRANLLWMAPEAEEPELWEALRRAAAEDFVRRLPAGLDTVVGDRGARLSGGERQRIALARALLTRPALLVLDEATSHVDPETEAQVRRALRELHGSTTIVVVAHRPGLVLDADRVVVLEAGRVVEQGPPGELLAREPSHLRRWARGADPASAAAGGAVPSG